LLHGMSRAQLLRLVCNQYIAPVERLLNLVAALADDNDALVGAERVDTVEKMQKQRTAGDRVEHLVRVGTHTGALPRGKDNDGEAALVTHGRDQWHGARESASHLKRL
jgi:hypothetical protein